MEPMKISGLKVKVSRRIFLSQENGFGVFKVLSLPERDSEIIVGNLFDVREGDTLEIEGHYIYHPKFGNQIKVDTFRTILPQDLDGIKKFLSSGRVKGVGKKSAEKIVDKFGMDTFEIIEKFPEKLNEIRGLRKSIIKKLSDSLKENKVLRELIVKL
ncbi:MAG: ATP-dependent RecD-like DNA helicase, partial [Candidatus Aminicenantes bacterium]|nr:ATP-dependent RecD-like DNA helicase [Candidatus Aminicenantes bacterium]